MYRQTSHTNSINRPIEACVILLPAFEFLHASTTFRKSFLETLAIADEKPPHRITPFPHTILTLSSYLLTHATSLSSPRAIAYANLALNVILVMVEHSEIIYTLCQPSSMDIRLCRQVCERFGGNCAYLIELSSIDRDCPCLSMSRPLGLPSARY